MTAEIVAGAARHLDLLPGIGAERMVWPVPFADGIPRLLTLRGRRVVLLASGDPFWHGAGTSVARLLAPNEWRALPAPSTFGLAAARLGWPLETVVCLGLHAAPLARLRRHLAPGVRAIVLVRDGAAAADLGDWLSRLGFAESRLWFLEALGGPRERIRQATAAAAHPGDIAHPVAVAVEVAGNGLALSWTGGLPDAIFAHDGQITRQAVRAITLSALAPKPGERLWDVGAGSGSIGIEWLLAHPAMEAVAIEPRADRAARVRANADALGADRLALVAGAAPEALAGLPQPDAVFVGGGLSEAVLAAVWDRLPAHGRLVVNVVTLEGEALVSGWQARVGGTLSRIALAEAGPLGGKRGWKAAYPVVQWSARR